jgi:hypothetical protein
MVHTNVIKVYDQSRIGKLHRQVWKGTQYGRCSHMSCKCMSSVSDSHYQNQTKSRITIYVALLTIQTFKSTFSFLGTLLILRNEFFVIKYCNG